MSRKTRRKGWREGLGIGLAVLATFLITTSGVAEELVVDDGTPYIVNSGIFYNNEVVGQTSSGVFSQSGFANTTNNILTLGQNTGSSGTYNLSAGSLWSMGIETVGLHGNGNFNQSGGNNTASCIHYLGHNAGGRGTYNLSGGSLTASRGASTTAASPAPPEAPPPGISSMLTARKVMT